MFTRRGPIVGASSVSTPVRRAVPVVLAVLLALIATCTPAAASAAKTAKSPKAPRSFGATIEDLAPYVGQTSCDPHVKKGTAKLGALLVRTYPGTSWASTYPCGADGTQSEHYEGRAIDWMTSVRDRQQHADARAFIRWLLATDRFGNRAAMARRLGVMYVIFNNRMWGAWSGRWEEYNGCAAPKLAARAYDNACHRTHVHISLSWNGARGRTTFWTGTVSPTDYGPCRPKGHKYAPKWTKANHTGCPHPSR
jgi:hypothetical protein